MQDADVAAAHTRCRLGVPATRQPAPSSWFVVIAMRGAINVAMQCATPPRSSPAQLQTSVKGAGREKRLCEIVTLHAFLVCLTDMFNSETCWLLGGQNVPTCHDCWKSNNNRRQKQFSPEECEKLCYKMTKTFFYDTVLSLGL